MNFNELDALLGSLLALERLPITINHRSEKINYSRKSKLRIITKALYRLVLAEIFYTIYIRKRLRTLRSEGEIYNSLKKTGCLKSLRLYLYLSKIGQTELLDHIGGRFDDRLFANFTIATTLYDASFDVSECRKYLRDFDEFIMCYKRIEPKDEFLILFNESVDYLRDNLDETRFKTFWNYIQIEALT